jgi:hypothetical protein
MAERARRAKRPKSAADVRGCAERMIIAVAKNVGEAAPANLRDLQRLENRLASAWALAIEGLRESHYTDGDIAEALGVSRQTVITRWPASAPRAVGAKAWRR